MEPSKRTILQDKVPRFIRLSIDQIRVPNCNFEWIDNGNFYPMSVPAVKEPVLPLLQLLQPILVVSAGTQVTEKSKKEIPVFDLVGGRRTLQLTAELKPRQTKVQAVLLGDQHLDIKSLEVMDLLCSVLLRRPDDETKTLLASALLEDSEFSDVASNFLDVSTAQKIADMLGISRATLHRITTEPRQKLATLANAPANAKTTLGIGKFFDEA